MTETAHHATAPEDRIPFLKKVAYGSGAFVNNLLASAIGGMMIVLNLGLGMNPALVGLLSALPRLTDAITDPLMGFISDNTRSRWGRRRPYLFVGAIAVGVIFAVLWQLPENGSESFYFWYFLVGSLIFYLAYTIYATPWVAMGYELTPDFHERTRLMGVQNFIGQLAYMIAPWFLVIMQWEVLFDDMVEGAAGLAIAVGAVAMAVGILPAVFLRERFAGAPPSDAEEASEKEKKPGGLAGFLRIMREFVGGFATALKFKPFLKLCAATFLVFNGFILIASFQSYVIIYYVFGGDVVQGAQYVGYSGSLGALSTFIVIPIVTWLATRIGKKKAFYVATAVSMVGYAMKWVCYSPDVPWLLLVPAPLMSFGLGGLFTIMPSMICEVVDADELETHKRREGMYGSIYWWVVKVGMAVALAAGGFLLNWTGFDVDLEAQGERTIVLMRACDAFIPFAASALAILSIATYSLTEDRAREIREQLEARRGAA
jgi:GPH family glycoside/pentoside/hexuronide:cation symporter